MSNPKCGGWQCPVCFIKSMNGWSGHPNPEDAPKCCRGEPMVPYAIQSPANHMTDDQETENFLMRERDDANDLMFCEYCGDMKGNCDCLREQQGYDKECDRYNRTGRGHDRYGL